MIVTTNIKLTDIIKIICMTFMEFKRNLSTAVIVIVTLIATTVLVIFYNNLLPFTLFGPLTTLWL